MLWLKKEKKKLSQEFPWRKAMRDGKREKGRGKEHITAPLQIILSKSRLLHNLMSLEIGEITFFRVSFISVGVANLWGLVFSLWDCTARCHGARCSNERSNKLTSRPVNRWGSSLWSAEALVQSASWFAEAVQRVRVLLSATDVIMWWEGESVSPIKSQ